MKLGGGVGRRREPYGSAAVLVRRWRVAHNSARPITETWYTSDEKEEPPSPYGRTPAVLSLVPTALFRCWLFFRTFGFAHLPARGRKIELFPKGPDQLKVPTNISREIAGISRTASSTDN